MKIRTDFVTNSSSSSYVSVKYTDNIFAALLKEFSDVFTADNRMNFSVEENTVSFSSYAFYGTSPKTEKEVKYILSYIIGSLLDELPDIIDNICCDNKELEDRGNELISRLKALNKDELLATCESLEYSYEAEGNFEDPSLLDELQDYLVGDLENLGEAPDFYNIESSTTYKDGKVSVNTEYIIDGTCVVDFGWTGNVSDIEKSEESEACEEKKEIGIEEKLEKYTSDTDRANYLIDCCISAREGAIEALLALADKHSDEIEYTVYYAMGLVNLTMNCFYQRAVTEISDITKILKELTDKNPESNELFIEYSKGLHNLGYFLDTADSVKYVLDEQKAIFEKTNNPLCGKLLNAIEKKYKDITGEIIVNGDDET